MKEKSDESKGSKAACEHTVPMSIYSERKNVPAGCYPKFLPYFLVSLSLVCSLHFEKQMKEKSDDSKGSKAACEDMVPLSMKSEKNVPAGCYPKFLGCIFLVPEKGI